MLKSNPFKKVFFLVSIIQVWDLVLLNLMFVLFYAIIHFFSKGASILSHEIPYLIIGNITYIISINCVYVMLHNRMVRPETIVSKSGRTILLQMLLFLAFLSIFNIPAPSIYVLFAFYIPTFIAISSSRLILRHIIGSVRYAGRNNREVVLVGNKLNMQQIAEIMNDRWNGYHLQGVFTDDDKINFDKNIKILGRTDNVLSYIDSNHVDELYCGLPSACKDEILPIINYCENNLIHFYSVPNYQNYLMRKMVLRQLGNVTTLAIRREPLSIMYNRLIKRAFDLVLSTLFLCIIYPLLYIIVGSIIKITSPGPVYFKQLRTGLDGRNFTCIKFRSMKQNDDCDTLQATIDDPRKTKFGKFLRHTNLDELPQFINVWKGEMSLVGPRPHMLEHTEKYSQLINRYMVRHLVKPGITGWAQVNGYRGETKELLEMEKRVKCDTWYLENWTFWLDIHIIVKTIWNMIKGEEEAY